MRLSALAVLMLAGRAFAAQEGELYASSQGLLLENSRFVHEAALDRLQQIRFAYREPSAEPGRQPAWMRAYGNRGSLDGDGAAARVEHRGSGLFVGLDRTFDPRWAAGVLAGHSRSDLDLDDRDAEADIDSYHLAGYAALRYYNQLGLKFGAAFSQHEFDGRRQGLRGEGDGHTLQAFVEGGYSMDFANFTIEAFTSLAYISLHLDRLRERGSGDALQVSADSQQVGQATFGWRAARRFEPAAGQRLTARASLGWRHVFSDTDVHADVRRADGSRLRSDGVPLSEDSLRLDLGLDYELKPQLYLGLAYAGHYADATRDNALSGRLSLWF
ncbi:autotransporter outer membrane beta-barrel domain-containing protein [Zestomonas carbonaria]|uniref:Extracellular serine protease n=1 Tax=Zestomonas carbonaria TaxID=2762745 RepID=A0A7U7I8Q8_9GAMM|nr:autotransporter outer membrane beta-barrel domain-containing protein [Pseudomonas carbonaria]CAD5107530.1 Extracellular serine protease [Pseudomonas carbonaria]